MPTLDDRGKAKFHPSPDNEQKATFHWKEGNKFGLEFAKSLFLFNSALVVALIGFIGANKPNHTASRWIEDAIMWFSFVWASSIVIFALGYFANLRQGNAYLDHPDAGHWERAQKLQNAIYLLVVVIISLLAAGFYCLFMAAGTT
jgi:amino acid permease